MILLAIRVITWSYDFAYEVFGDRPVAEASEEIVPVQISDGASTNEIAAILDKKGLIKYKYAFIIHVGLSQYKGMLKPGNYELSPIDDDGSDACSDGRIRYCRNVNRISRGLCRIESFFGSATAFALRVYAAAA